MNLHPLRGSEGFDTLTVGDARERSTWNRAGIGTVCGWRLFACRTTTSLTQVTAAMSCGERSSAVVARCCYVLKCMAAARKAGAAEVVSEEAEAGAGDSGSRAAGGGGGLRQWELPDQ